MGGVGYFEAMQTPLSVIESDLIMIELEEKYLKPPESKK